MIYQTDDVIAAISTSLGGGGIGIVRLSGSGAVQIADRIFKNPLKKRLDKAANYTLTYGHIFDYQNGALIDEVLVSVMRSPHSYTTQDVVEINCHGGVVAMQSILRSVINAGARLAEPGEFTKRAFLGGRIDLTQAEAVMDIISAKSKRSLTLSNAQLGGSLGESVRHLDDLLVDLLSDMEANIDYPEYDIEEVSACKIDETLHTIIDGLDALIDAADNGQVFREGLPTAIIGSPNVGKSSLMNRLTQTDKAIVTDIPGTTRDMIEEMITINDVPFRIIDTAGIHHTDDVVEKIGVDRATKLIDDAELILFLTDVSRETSPEELELYDAVKNKNTIFIGNKSDLTMNNKYQFKDKNFMAVSTLNGMGLEELQKKMVQSALGKDHSEDVNAISINTRQAGLLSACRSMIENALNTLRSGMPTELISIDIQEALSKLREISGKEIGSAIVDSIFSKFCLGK